MKKFLAILLLLGLAATFSVADDKPAPIAEQLGLRSVDPQPIAVAFTDSDDVPINPKHKLEPKDWQLTKAERLPDGILEMSNEGSALCHSYPIQPGFYYFQIDQKVVGPARSQVVVGEASFGFFLDNMYAADNYDWKTFSHFFRVPETENQMRIRMKADNLHSASVHFKNIQLLPAQALLNLAPKGQPLRDIYWGENAVSRTKATGEFLPLGRMERIERDPTTTNINRMAYSFYWEKGPDSWGLYPSRRMEQAVFPSASNEARPIEKFVGEPRHPDKYEDVILKFELRPVSIGVNGEFHVLPPIRFLSACLQGHCIDEYDTHRNNMFWSADGKTWNVLKPDIESARKSMEHWPPALPKEIFPCERFYMRFKAVAGDRGLPSLDWLRVRAVIDTDQYYDYGQTSYFRVVPGEAKESGMKINPLYTARNQVYFLFHNETDKEQQPKFAARLGYGYSEQKEPKAVVFRSVGNTVKEFDDVTCHWEVLGDSDMILPGEERICVFTLATSKLRASSHMQRGPSVSDVFDVEFDLDTYKMLNEQMRFFPPRLAIE